MKGESRVKRGGGGLNKKGGGMEKNEFDKAQFGAGMKCIYLNETYLIMGVDFDEGTLLLAKNNIEDGFWARCENVKMANCPEIQDGWVPKVGDWTNKGLVVRILSCEGTPNPLVEILKEGQYKKFVQYWKSQLIYIPLI